MKRPRRTAVEVLRIILLAARKLNAQAYSLSELARTAGVTRKTLRRWLRILRVVAELRALPLETKVAYYEGHPGRGRKQRRKRLMTVRLELA